MSRADTPNLAAIRSEYTRAGLDVADVDADPLKQFDAWLTEAVTLGLHEPTAMTLATASPDGAPDARIVLLKGVDRGLVFYTNYESQKGRELAANPRACAVFFWPDLERQARVTGNVERVTDEESRAYFHSRPRGSQIGAWASAQSEPLDSRATLEAHVREIEARYPKEIPLPPFWGGFRLVPSAIELWQGRENRLHDRIKYVQNTHKDGWKILRLQP